jgi:outer membrane protein assembly factor BamB
MTRGLASITRFASVLVFLALANPQRASALDWPEMRGPFQNGHVQSDSDSKPIGLPLQWSETQNVKWKTAIPLRGWSTPVILGGQVWMTTATEDGHDFYALCVDADSGKITVNKQLFHADNPEPQGNNVNSYATPSPVIEPGRVYAHFGSYGTACLDTASASVVWQRADLPCRHYRGPSSSPVLYDNLLILTLDGVDHQYTVALDKKTGQTVWNTKRSVAFNDEDSENAMVRLGDQRKAHSTPIIITNAGQPLLLSAGAKACYGYDPRSGKEIWRVQYPDFSAAPRPIFENGVAYFVTGLSKTELLAVKVDGQGDDTDSAIVWRRRTHIGKYASPILVDGLIYTAAEQSFLTCIDAGTGDVVWTERIGGSYEGSPLYADGRIYFFSVQGTTTVLKPGRTCDVIGTNTLDDGLMACPAVAGKAFYLRTRTHLYRIESDSSPAAKLPM